MQIPADKIELDVQRLVDELRNIGYTTREERYDDVSFGDALLLLERGNTAVRLTRERSQWLVEVTHAGRSGWFEPVVWHAFLESSALPLGFIAFGAEADLLLTDLARIEAVNDHLEDQQLADLRMLQSRRAEAATS